MNSAVAAGPTSTPAPMTFARARLWLGMTTVGSIVAASSLLLLFEVPSQVLADAAAGVPASVGVLGLAVFAFASVHAVPDVIGGYLIPKHFGRLDRPAPAVVRDLIRAIIVQSVVLWALATATLLAARFAGLAGVVGAAGAASLLLLVCRPGVARAVGRVRPDPADSTSVISPDAGFTGGIDGVLRSKPIVMPANWRDALSADQLNTAMARRREAVSSGAWQRGRVFAIVFTLVGVLLAGIASGANGLGTAEGIIRLSLWFTLWSFLGLLTLPTLSRWAVLRVDASIAAHGPSSSDELEHIDALGDGETRRPRLIETIFHPVPSLHSRRSGDHALRLGFWDVARTSLYLSSAGLGLLGRAVHCNCGRPALWAYLPSA